MAAALAADYTKVEQFVFVRGQEEGFWVGMIDPGTARDLLADVFPRYERYYRDIRQDAAVYGDANAPPDRDAEITFILLNWPGKFNWDEAGAKQVVTSDLLWQWLRVGLDTDTLPHGPLIPLLQYQINTRPRRYTALTAEGRLIDVVDKSELAARTTDEVLRRQLA